MPTNAVLKAAIRECLSTRWGSAALLTTFMSLISAVFSLPVNAFAQGTPKGAFFALAILLVLSLLYTIIRAGFLQYFLHLLRGETPRFSDLFSPLTMQPDRFLLVGLFELVLTLLYAVPCAILFSYIVSARPAVLLFWLFFVLGGIAYLFARLHFIFALPLLLDNENTRPIDALKQSAALLRGRKAALIKLLLSYLGWIVPLVLTGGLAMLLISPYLTAGLMQFYRLLLSEPLPAPSEDRPEAGGTSTLQ